MIEKTTIDYLQNLFSKIERHERAQKLAENLTTNSGRVDIYLTGQPSIIINTVLSDSKYNEVVKLIQEKINQQLEELRNELDEYVLSKRI